MINDFYYKGDLVNIKDDLFSSDLVLAYKRHGTIEFNDDLTNQLSFFTLSDEERKNILDWLNERVCNRTVLNNGLIKLFKDKYTTIRKNGNITILFEKVIDEKGDIYARELKTGLLFPLMKNVSKTGNYECNIKYIKSFYEYKVNYKYRFGNHSINPILSYVENEEVIDKSKVDNYNLSVEEINKIKDYYDKNELKEMINIQIINKQVDKRNMMNKYIEEIELGLSRLKHINKDFYDKFNNYYNDILNSNYTNDRLIIIDRLKELLKEITIVIKYLDNDLKTLDENIDDEIFKINNESKLEWYLVLNSLVNRENDIYEKRKNNVKISLLYIFDLYNNKRNINELKNTNVEYNYKTILLNLITLKDLCMIDIDIDYKKDYSFEEVIDLIYNMRLKNDKDSILKLSKEIK